MNYMPNISTNNWPIQKLKITNNLILYILYIMIDSSYEFQTDIYWYIMIDSSYEFQKYICGNGRSAHTFKPEEMQFNCNKTWSSVFVVCTPNISGNRSFRSITMKATGHAFKSREMVSHIVLWDRIKSFSII